MSVRGEDELRIPIEIKTEDIKELRDIIQGLKEAQQDARSATPTTKARAEVGAQKGAVRTAPFEERGGIFGGVAGGKGGTFRDKSSAAPIQRENEFKKLRNQVDALSETQGEGIQSMDLIMGGAIARNFSAGRAAAAGGTVLKGGTVAASAGALGGIVTRMIPIIGPLLIAAGFIKTIIDQLIKPGGPFDRRYRRVIRDEISSATERQEKAVIRQGLKILRITPYATFRGESTSIQGQKVKEGNPIYGQDFDMMQKGIGP